jgi:2-(3-amino-3-carboxypropyl)histidine synthase
LEPQTFDLEENRLQKEIVKRKAKTVLIQLPEGLKNIGPRLATLIEEVGSCAIVSADPCYGACDLATTAAESLGADLIIHFGHSSQNTHEGIPVLFLEARANVSIKEAIEQAIPLLTSWDKIGLVTTVQHIHKIKEAKTVLLNAGKTVAIGDAGKLEYAGQVIGCDFSNAKAISKNVKGFLFVGGGRFHAIGVALATAKPTVIADPFEKRAYALADNVSKILKRRWANIATAKKAINFGILVGLKPGQKNVKEALRIKARLQISGKIATLLALREITPAALMTFPKIDAFINTACPRLFLDAEPHIKPVLSLNEGLVLIGEKKWEDLCRTGWF